MHKRMAGWTALHCAAFNGHVETAVTLLRATGQENSDTSDNHGYTPFLLAALGGYTRCCLEMKRTQDRINIYATDHNGWSALHWAAEGGYTETVLMLVNTLNMKGIEKLVTKEGHTALHLAAARGHTDTCRTLIKECGWKDITCRVEKTGQTALHGAARAGYAETCRALVKEFGFQTDVRNNLGETPLHLAALHGHLPVCQCLVEECGMPCVGTADYNSRNAYHMAIAVGEVELAGWLLQKMTAAKWEMRKYLFMLARRPLEPYFGDHTRQPSRQEKKSSESMEGYGHPHPESPFIALPSEVIFEIARHVDENPQPARPATPSLVKAANGVMLSNWARATAPDAEAGVRVK